MDPRQEHVYFNFPIANFSSVKRGADPNINTLYNQLTNNFLKGIERKHVVVIFPGPIKFLERSTSKINPMYVEYLNNVGLDIHLFDIPTLYSKTNPNDKMYHNFENEDFEDIFCREFDSIDKFAKNNKLKNVNVYCNAYLIEIFLCKYPNLNLYCTPIGWQYPTYWTFNFTQSNPNTITKKFWCGNWKYAEHRHLTASLLSNYDNVNLSWVFDANTEDLKSNIWFDLDNFKYADKIYTGSALLKNNAPINMDQKFDKALNIDNKELPNIDHSETPKSFYEESFCAIITETKYAQPFAALTEKTMQAIIHARPFVMVGPPNTLDFVKEMGWKTFDNWWDESYDLEENHEKRLEKIFDVIEYINGLTIEELKRMYIEMMPVINHNQKQLVKLQKTFQKHNIDNNKYFRTLRNVH